MHKWTFSRLLFLLPLCLSCAAPNPPVGGGTAASLKSALTKTIPPPQIVSSIQDLPIPPILGVNYISTIGQPGQGAGQFLRPAGLDIDHQGRLYVADAGNDRIQVVDSEGNFVSEYGGRGWRTGEFDNPTDVAINFQRTELLYVADTDNHRIQYCNLIDQIFYVMTSGGLEETDEVDDVDTQIEFDLPGGVSVEPPTNTMASNSADVMSAMSRTSSVVSIVRCNRSAVRSLNSVREILTLTPLPS